MSKFSVKKILVTRAEHQSENVCCLLEKYGLYPVRFPVIEIKAKALSALEKQYVANIEQYQYIFFVSTNAVNFALQVFNGKIVTLQQATCIAVGAATLTALSGCGINSAIVPTVGSNTEALLAMPELQILNNRNCLVVRGVGGRELLANTLRKRGATVDYLELYQRGVPVNNDCSSVKTFVLNNALAAIFIYSADALRHLIQILAEDNINKCLLTIPLVVISRRVSVVAEQIGFKKIIIADAASDQAMINALLNGEECGRSN